MKRELSIYWWMRQWAVLAAYERAVERRWEQGNQIDQTFIDAFDASAIGTLPRWVRFVLTYMENIEGAVWKIYFDEVSTSPLRNNPVVSTFLARWYAEEEMHRKLLDKILATCGGPVRGRILPTWNSSWVTWVFGAKLFGPVIFVIGFVNELMTARAYRALGKRSGNARLAGLLDRIAVEEYAHYSFYYAMAGIFLDEGGLVRRFTARMVNAFAVGVGVNYRSRRDADKVFRMLFRKDASAFLRIADNIRKLPGLETVNAIERIHRRAFGAR